MRSPRSLRVLVVADPDSVHTRRLTRALAVAGAEVHLAGFSAVTSHPGVKTHLLHPARGRDARYLLAAPQLKALIRRLEPDLVNAHYLSSFGVMTAMTRPSRLVQTAWGSDLLVTAQRPLHRRLARFALRRAILATGDSQSLLDEISRISPTTPTHRFVFGPPLAQFRTHRKERIVVSPRNHEANYQIELVLDAWRIARKNLPGHRLIMAGAGSRTVALRRRASPDVEFRGLMDHEELLAVMGSSRLVVSVPRNDATSAAVLEALAARCSVVATDLEANREWLPASHLVPIDADPSDLASAMVACVAKPLQLDPMWSMERQIEQLLAAMGRSAGLA